ncbi:tRNA lysidine(34) synthetase TilS [uncultured Endozoicomonas sp.]|uniref:tRNA lysidine(34) synthetase TilS n=1 Tax=uncultured Endozoicomonas sp. TaxID=432652 RepID=UPI002626C53C|nr:tRNA lysidine(34) synthetase TilS [uncultured Endozoicomonas sp.]
MSTELSLSSHPLNSEWVLERLNTSLHISLQSVPFTVAFSGGVDSTVLLHLMVQLRNQGHIKTLNAVHIHHGLSTFADQWADHCRSLCQQWNVPLTVESVVLKNQGQGIEQAARDARYGIFTDAVKDGGVLLQGHHRDDQTETILQRLFRGTGVDGFQGMPQQRPIGTGTLLRPLLSIPRLSIESYAKDKNLQHIEDDSNSDEHFARNFLRQSLIPAIETRWPGASERVVELAKEVTVLSLEQQSNTTGQLQTCIEYHPEWLLGDQPLLNLKRLESFTQDVQNRIVRGWLKQQNILLSSRRLLGQIFYEVINARADGEPRLKVDRHIWIYRFQHCLVMVDERYSLTSFEPFIWHWQSSSVVALGDHCLTVSDGVTMNCLPVQLPEIPLLLCQRRHIDKDAKIAIAGRAGRKTLKRWLQEYHVPPWLREYLPFIYNDEQMVAAPGFWVCEGYQGVVGRASVLKLEPTVLSGAD